MELHEALNILKQNNYIFEKLEYNEERFKYTKYLSPHDKIKNLANFKNANDGYSFRHFNNKTTRRLKDININDDKDFKTLILNGNIFGKGLFKHKSKKDDLIDIIYDPKSYTHLIHDLYSTYSIDFDTLKYMIEDDNSIDEIFDMCLFIWLKYNKKIFKNIYYKKIPIYRGIKLPKNENPNDFLKNNHFIGTSWTTQEEIAYNFASNTDKDETGYIITAYLNDIKNIDIATTLLWRYKTSPFADDEKASEAEIRIRNSSLLKNKSIKQIK